jgi:hypothetical protein
VARTKLESAIGVAGQQKERVVLHCLNVSSPPRQAGLPVIRAELIGADICTALGTTVQSSTPVLAMCRQLIAAGHGPTTRLEAYRGDVLCLWVRSLGEAARLTVKAMGNGAPGFATEGTAGRAAAPPIRQSRRRASCDRIVETLNGRGDQAEKERSNETRQQSRHVVQE